FDNWTLRANGDALEGQWSVVIAGDRQQVVDLSLAGDQQRVDPPGVQLVQQVEHRTWLGRTPGVRLELEQARAALPQRVGQLGIRGSVVLDRDRLVHQRPMADGRQQLASGVGWWRLDLEAHLETPQGRGGLWSAHGHALV